MDDSDRNNEPTTSQNSAQPAWSPQPSNMDSREEGLKEEVEGTRLQNPFLIDEYPPPEQIVEGFDMLMDELRALQDRIEKQQMAQLERGKENKLKMSSNAKIESESTDADTCRICSGPAEPDMPLLHPCKCSGTIRNVHQECLKSWLDTSHRTRCDLCNHVYTYQKVYSPSMPTSIPMRVLIGPMFAHIAKWFLIALRVLLVGTVWLALLPALLYWCWRVGFWLSDYASLRISGRLYHLDQYGGNAYNVTIRNATHATSTMPSTIFTTSIPDSVLPPSPIYTSSIPMSTGLVQERINSMLSTFQLILQPTNTEAQPTPHPSVSAIGSAIVELASMLQERKQRPRRMPFQRKTQDDDAPIIPPDILNKIIQSIPGLTIPKRKTPTQLIIQSLLRLLADFGGFIRLVLMNILSFHYALLVQGTRLAYEFLSEPRKSVVSIWGSTSRALEDLADPIVTGQIIAVAIVVAFVSFFFLREWVLANADVGMFDNDAANRQQGNDPAPNGAADAQNEQPILGVAPAENAAPAPAAAIGGPDDVDLLDLGLAEPRPPSPNLISVEEQAELMKEVRRQRAEKEEVFLQKTASLDEWQWEKREELLGEWREQKLKEILDKVAQGDTRQKDNPNDLIPLVQDDEDEAWVDVEPSSWKGPTGKHLDEPSTKDKVNMHAEPIGRPQKGPQVYSESSSSDLRPPSWAIISDPVDYSVPFDASAAQSFANLHAGPSSSVHNKGSTSAVVENTTTPSSASIEAESLSSATRMSLFSEPESLPYFPLSDAFQSKDHKISDQVLLAQLDHSPQLSQANLGPSNSVFATLVPPAPPPSTLAKLPFSIREFPVEPLQGKIPSDFRSGSRPSTTIHDSHPAPIPLTQNGDTHRAANSSHTRGKSHRKITRHHHLVYQTRSSKSSEPVLSHTPSGIDVSNVDYQKQDPQFQSTSGNESQHLYLSPESGTALQMEIRSLRPNDPDSRSSVDPSRSTRFNVNATPFHPKSYSAPITPTIITPPTTPGFPIRPSKTDSPFPDTGHTLAHTAPQAFAVTPSSDPFYSLKQSRSVSESRGSDTRILQVDDVATSNGYKASQEVFPTVNRGRTLTARASVHSEPLVQEPDAASTDVFRVGLQNHQRAKSLSSHPLDLSRQSPIRNHLLASNPEAPSTSSPILWHGLPDPRLSMDEKGSKGPVENVQRKTEKLPLDAKEQPPTTTLPREGSSLYTAKESNGQDSVRPHEGDKDTDRHALDYVTAMSLSILEDTEGNPISFNTRTPQMDRHSLSGPSSTASFDKDFGNTGRQSRPGPIELPNPNFVTNAASGSLVKRPSLPSAASPAAVEEYSPSKIALYQAPEEVRSHLKEVPNLKRESDEANPHHYFEQVTENKGEGSSKLSVGIVGEVTPQVLLVNMEPVVNPAMDDLERALDDGVLNEDDPIPMDEPVNGGEVAPPAAAPAPAEEPWDDEWAHMLEAVGMIGPWYGIVQNAALVMVIFNVTLVVGVFMPYIIGKTVTLLLVDPVSIISTINKDEPPGFWGAQLPPLWTPGSSSMSPIGQGVASLIKSLLPIEDLPIICSLLIKNFGDLAVFVKNAIWRNFNSSQSYSQGSWMMTRILHQTWSIIRPTSILSRILRLMINILAVYRSNISCGQDELPSYSLRNVITAFNLAVCSFPESALSGSSEFKNQILDHWFVSTFRSIAVDRTLAVIFGYLITTFGLMIHAKRSAQKSSYMVLTLLKVGTFVAFEAVIKPLVFGILINLFTLSLFPNTSIRSRLQYWTWAPYTNILHHWLLGNVVVVQLLHSLVDLQSFLRPGALMHVRRVLDPTTPSIRDMINKSILWHIAKYTTTLVSTTCLLWALFGLTIDLNNTLTSNFAPLRWNLKKPAFNIPIDLILLHAFIPATIRFLKIRRNARNTAKTFVIEWSKYLHLQNVLFDEMTVPCPDEGVEGSFWRVPVAEGAIRLAGKPRAIQTDYNGNGITQEDRDMIDLQILASEKAHRIPQNDYKVIFYPSKFRLRLIAFTIVVWAAIFGTIWTSVTLPIRIGRLLFKITLNIVDIHDAYSWIAGLYLIWFATFIRYVVGREQRRWSKYFSLRPRSHFPVKYFIIHTFTIIGRLAFAVVMLIFVIPLLVGLLFEVYMVLPLSYHLYPNTTPVLRIADAWAAGMILCAIALQSARLVPAQQLPNFIDRLRHDGWLKVKVRSMAAEIGPFSVGLLALVLLPFISQYLIPTRLFHSAGIENVILKTIIPTLFMVLLSSIFALMMHRVFGHWADVIRDEKYLDREIIQNFEDGSIGN